MWLSLWAQRLVLPSASRRATPLSSSAVPEEASGAGALMVIGVSESTALGIMLVNRVLNAGTTRVMTLIALVVLRDEALAVVRG